MLEQLLIRSFALVDKITLEFGPGFTVLTGETGAGKSLVVDAVNFLLGAKADKDIIRVGEEKAMVEGWFDLSACPEALHYLQEISIDLDDDRLVLSRELSRSGRAVCRAGGTVISLTQLKIIASMLMDIHGQHEHQSLMDDARQLAFLDAYGNETHQQTHKACQKAFDRYHELKVAMEKARAELRDQEERLIILSMRKKELENAHLIEGEEEELKQKKEWMRNAGRMQGALSRAHSALSGGDRDENGALPLLKRMRDELNSLNSEDVRISSLKSRAENLYYEAEDLELHLHKALKELDCDESELERVEERLDLIRKLERKYGPGIPKMIKTLEETKAEIERLSCLNSTVDQIEDEKNKAEKAYLKIAEDLSERRKKLALEFQTKIEETLRDLNMRASRFQVCFESRKDPFNREGLDELQFLLSANAGEELRPLAKVASGGELSRVMLALKSLSAEHNEIPSMVFDEIDTGISGKTAQVVAEKIWDIARYRQVFCVSHLQQIACMANCHYLVEKYEKEGRTLTRLRVLEGEDRENEIARILGELSTPESARTHARAMLEEARQYRGTHKLP